MLLDIQDVHRSYGERRAVAGASLTIASAGVTCLLGQSGCGKSTLLRLIAGLEPVESGVITIAGNELSGPGQHVAPETRGIGLVFQDHALFPHLDVEANVGFGLRRLDRSARRSRVGELLERMHLSDRMQAWPHQLSGGEQQRVAIARALAPAPGLLLLDEPFSGLDGRLRREVSGDLLAALAASGTSAIIVTHDADEAMGMADTLALMDAGRILQAGRPNHVYRHPVSMDAAQLLGEVNAFEAPVQGGAAQCVFGTVPVALPDGPALILARPEAFRLSAQGATAEVASALYGGASTSLTLICQGTRAVARIASVDAPAHGERVNIALDPLGCAVVPL